MLGFESPQPHGDTKHTIRCSQHVVTLALAPTVVRLNPLHMDMWCRGQYSLQVRKAITIQQRDEGTNPLHHQIPIVLITAASYPTQTKENGNINSQIIPQFRKDSKQRLLRRLNKFTVLVVVPICSHLHDSDLHELELYNQRSFYWYNRISSG